MWGVLKRICLIVVAVLAVLGCATAGVVYAFGTTYGTLILGHPVFLGHVTPKRYAQAVAFPAQYQGIHGESAEFDEAYGRLMEHARHAKAPAELYGDLDSLLDAAGGKHSFFTPPEDVRSSTEKDNPAPTVVRRGAVVTAKVPSISWNADGQAYADTLAQGLVAALPVSPGAADAVCGAVVDLRGNGGGDMGPMLAGLSPLLPDGTALEWIGRSLHSTPVTISGNGVRGGGTPTTTTAQGKAHVPVAVLVDGQTASSGEATMLAFKGLDARTFGQPTAGYTTANMAYRLPDGAEFAVTTSFERDRTGRVYQGEPVEPDEVTDHPEQAAQQWLSHRGCRGGAQG